MSGGEVLWRLTRASFKLVELVAIYAYMGGYLCVWYIYWWLGWTDENPNVWRKTK